MLSVNYNSGIYTNGAEKNLWGVNMLNCIRKENETKEIILLHLVIPQSLDHSQSIKKELKELKC